MPEARRVKDLVEPALTVAVTEAVAAIGEDIWWDAMPSQTPEGGVGFALIVWIKSAYVGDLLSGVMMMTNPIQALQEDDGQDRMNTTVLGFINNMLARRTSDLSTMNGHGKAGPGLVGG